MKYIYLTHCHGDHIGGVKKLKELKGGKILIHRDDAIGLHDKNINLTEYMGMHEDYLEADARVDDGDLLHLGNLEFKVLHTPGHTAGSTSLYCEKEKCLFSKKNKIKNIELYVRKDGKDFSVESIFDTYNGNVIFNFPAININLENLNTIESNFQKILKYNI